MLRLTVTESSVSQDKRLVLHITTREETGIYRELHSKQASNGLFQKQTLPTTIECSIGEVRVYDSIFQYCDKETKYIILDQFQCGPDALLIY